MTQLFKTANFGTISQYFTCYCYDIIAICLYSWATRIRNVTFVQQLTVHTSYLTLAYNSTNIRLCWQTNVIYTLFSRYLFFSQITCYFT